MIFASMTSSGTTGMASRCATVPRALANQRDHGEDGQTIDDLHDGVEPAWRHVGIEHAPDDQIDRCFAAAFTPSFEGGDVVHENALDLAGAVARLHRGPRININLDGWERSSRHAA
jgi:hypothetical protein